MAFFNGMSKGIKSMLESSRSAKVVTPEQVPPAEASVNEYIADNISRVMTSSIESVYDKKVLDALKGTTKLPHEPTDLERLIVDAYVYGKIEYEPGLKSFMMTINMPNGLVRSHRFDEDYVLDTLNKFGAVNPSQGLDHLKTNPEEVKEEVKPATYDENKGWDFDSRTDSESDREGTS